MAREKQIEFPPEQSPVRWLTPALLLASPRLHRHRRHRPVRPPERGVHRPCYLNASTVL